MRAAGHAVEQLALPPECAAGTFVPPTIIELPGIAELKQEVFGPVLHVVRWRRADLGVLVDAINATGYGLTFGLHTRLDETIAEVTARIEAGNVYINRNVIGAVVGVQPFGGRGLSGTGPKAGGPLYLGRLVREAPAQVGAGCADAVLADFFVWLRAHGEDEVARRAEAYGARSRLGFSIELPGPVGERDVYRLRPRGKVMLRASSASALLEQIAVVLATGCEALVDGDVPARLPPRVASRVGALADQPLAAALVEGDAAAILAAARALSARPGPLVPLHAARSGDLAYEPDWLLEEVSISTDTTAAGGNASLMMLG